jgi:hypothetical protein
VTRPWAWLLLVPLLSACGILGIGGGLQVEVTDPQERPRELAAATVPVARYYADSGSVVYLSNLLYSGSCPPEGHAEQEGETVTLTVERGDAHGESCTSDAQGYTFTISDLDGEATVLVVLEDGQDDLRLGLAD